MPNAAKLFAAVAFLAVGFLAAETYKPGLPPETQFGQFSLIVAAIGALCGWMVMGGLVGRSHLRAGASGMRTSVTIVFWALLGFSIREMVLRSLRRRYDGVFSAVEGTFEIMAAYGLLLLRPEPLAVLVVGGFLGGVLANWAGRRWR